MDENDKTTEETLTEDEKLKVNRLLRMKIDLEKTYNSLLEQFCNFIHYKNYNIETERTTIMNMDMFNDLYMAFYLYYMILDVENTPENITEEQIGIIQMLDYSYAYSKVNIRSIISKLVNEQKRLSKQYPAYEKNNLVILSSFYDTTILQKYNEYKGIN